MLQTVLAYAEFRRERPNSLGCQATRNSGAVVDLAPINPEISEPESETSWLNTNGLLVVFAVVRVITRHQPFGHGYQNPILFYVNFMDQLPGEGK